MDAIRQIVRIPIDHELKIKIPEHITENELMERWGQVNIYPDQVTGHLRDK